MEPSAVMRHDRAEDRKARENKPPFALEIDGSLPFLGSIDNNHQEHWNEVANSVNEQAFIAATVWISALVEPCALHVLVLSQNFSENALVLLLLVIVVMRHLI